MTIKHAGQILIEEIESAVAELKSCVTPIFDVNEKGEAELLGSGVLIALCGDTFLLRGLGAITVGHEPAAERERRTGRP